MLTITLLGTAATMPLPDRALSTAFAACGGHGLLWDCGEGTQAAARRAYSSRELDAEILQLSQPASSSICRASRVR